MGTLRLLLALSVVIGHSSSIIGVNLVGGQAAVQAFYIISGFYMTLILREKYIGKNSSYKLFISNRLLRLLPIYWVVLFCVVLAAVISFFFSEGTEMMGMEVYLANFSSVSIGSYVFLIFTNVFLIFQDIVMFMGIDITDGTLFFTPNFTATSPQLHEFLLVPQAWTIGIEITFYLIAPFIVRRKLRVICIVIIASIALRIFLFFCGFKGDPWSYRFFPTELLFFLLGVVGYNVYKKLSGNIEMKYLYSIFGGVLLLTFIYDGFHFPGKIYLFLLIFSFSVPFVFFLTRKWKYDRWIGELSYPVYISHFFLLSLLNKMNISIINSNLGLFLVMACLIFSVLLNRFVAERVESYRQGRVNEN